MANAEEDRDPEWRVLTSSRDLDDYDILAMPMISAAVPHKTTESFRKMIWATMLTYAWGNTSVDHVLKRYAHLWEKRKHQSFQRDPRILALREMVGVVDQVANKLDEVELTGGAGRICARAALSRLEASFKAAYGLIRKEYVFETDAVVRLVLEQLAWSYVASGVDDSDVLELKPSKCIAPFKNIFPDCGVLYGELSEWAHIDPSIAKNYLSFHEAGTPVVRRSSYNSFESGAHLMALAPVYLKVAQELFSLFSEEQYESIRHQLQACSYRYQNSVHHQGFRPES
jgi:hypothetical protein